MLHAMLRWKVHHLPHPTTKLPLTPDPSPQTSPITSTWDSDEDTVMSGQDSTRSRPKTVSKSSFKGGNSPTATPLLTDVLNNTSPPPYTLSAFTAFLSQNHCLETLEFVMAARKYQQNYNSTVASLASFPITTESQEVCDLQDDWEKLINTFLSPGSLREVNLSSEVRDELLLYQHDVMPPPPEVLEPAIKRMRDLMQESIWMPFLHSCASQAPSPQPQSASSWTSNGGDLTTGIRQTSDEKKSQTKSKHSPSSSADFSVTRAPQQSYHRPLSALTNALHMSSSGSHKVPQVSHTSVGSSTRDTLTDDSSSMSPAHSDVDPMTPPTTPPFGEMGLGISSQSYSKGRSDSGAWKRMGAKLGWSRKRSVGGFRETLEEEYR